MNHLLKRYVFKSGLDIIAPRKCGTRWLESLDWELDNNKNTIEVYKNLSKHIHNGTIFIWRPVREHMLSALKTELSFYHTEKSPFDIVTEMEAGICDHWYPYLYKELYPIWSNTPFRFLKLRALSELNSSQPPSTTTYEFNVPEKWDSIEAALNTLSPKHLIRLNKLISDEEKWLKLMIEPQYSGRSWEEYSDLEDSFFKMRSNVIDLEEMVNKIIDLKKEDADKFRTIIRELENSNTKLGVKIRYAELVIGKLRTKLI
jgi:hypothetical protein